MKTLTKITLAMVLGTSTLALAGDAAKAPAAPAKAEPAKDAKAAPPAKMEMPKPAPEIAALAKELTGTWKCTGKAAMDPNDMTKMMDMKATMKFALDNTMGGWWIKSNFDGGMMKMEGYMTFDVNSKKWIAFDRDNMGGSEMKTSDGPKDNKVVFLGDARGNDPKMGMVKVRETHDMSDAKAGVKMTGEMSMDGGKTWKTGWEATCKK